MSVETLMCVLTKLMFLLLLFFYFVLNIPLMTDVFSMGSLNVNGAREAKRRALIYETFKTKQLDVLFLQETHSCCENEGVWRREWEGEVVLSHNTSLSGGERGICRTLRTGGLCLCFVWITSFCPKPLPTG